MSVSQSWFAKMGFEGYKPFLFGCVVLPKNAHYHEIEKAFLEEFAKHIPPNSIPVKILSIVPGTIIVQPHGPEVEP